VVSLKVKIWALHVEWTRCLVCCLALWVHFLYFSFEDCLGVSPLDILSRPAGFDSSSLPPFFRSFLSGWCAVDKVFFCYWLLFWYDYIFGLCYFHESFYTFFVV